MKRCAIYTRKSSSEGLLQGFNSLDAQRQFCENFVASQAGEGWVALPTRYDDGGFSGGSLDRPAVTRLIEDVGAGLIDVVVVYKIDRLSRSLIDFSALIGRFEKQSVSFVAVTQSFNTTSSVGRLTLNILLSFAQFERELASERLRDKAAASRAVGRWQGGPRPFGYRVVKGLLVVDEIEAEAVRYAFRRYPQVGAVRLVAQELEEKGVVNKFGTPYSASGLIKILKNRLYRGDLTYFGKPIPGFHQAIITEASWLKTQEALATVARTHRPYSRPNIPNPLKGCIYGPRGGLISQDFVYNRYGKLYRYYMPSGRRRYSASLDPDNRFRADDFDRAVFNAIKDFIPLGDRRTISLDQQGVLSRLVQRIDLGQDEMIISLRNGATVSAPVAGRVRKKQSRPRSKSDLIASA